VTKAPTALPYRRAVGAAVFNRDGLVWVGRRSDVNAEGEGAGHWWQMPQGGLDGGEEPEQAVFRELYEETSIKSVKLIRQAPEWLSYDLPVPLVPTSWGGKYRGQTQKWFAARFTGQDSEINLAPSGHKQEFDQWRWVKMHEVIDAIVPFKKPVYEQVIAAFRHLG